MMINAPLNMGSFFAEFFSASTLAMNNKDGLGRCVHEVIKNFEAENTVYLELRSSPKIGVDYDIVGYYTTIIEKCKKSEAKLPVRLIVSLNRGIPDLHFYDDLLTQLQKVPEWQKYIVGMDLSGDPLVKNFSDFVPLLKGAQQLGLKVTLHTSEIEEHVKEIPEVLAVRPARIGHFNYYTQKELEQVRDLGIVVEVCISSNVVVKQLQSVMDHHVEEFRSNGLKYCLNTDDVLLLNNSLTEEYLKYSRIVKADEKECYQLAKATVAYTFDEQIQPQLLEHFREFEGKWQAEYPFLGKQ